MGMSPGGLPACSMAAIGAWTCVLYGLGLGRSLVSLDARRIRLAWRVAAEPKSPARLRELLRAGLSSVTAARPSSPWEDTSAAPLSEAGGPIDSAPPSVRPWLQLERAAGATRAAGFRVTARCFLNLVLRYGGLFVARWGASRSAPPRPVTGSGPFGPSVSACLSQPSRPF